MTNASINIVDEKPTERPLKTHIKGQNKASTGIIGQRNIYTHILRTLKKLAVKSSNPPSELLAEK